MLLFSCFIHFFCFSLFRSNTTTTISFFSVYFSACNFRWVSHPSVADSKVAPLFLKECVCIDFGGLWDRTRGGTPHVLPNSWICSIFELVKWKNFSLAVSSIFNLNVLFQRRMCLLISLRFYISFRLLFRAILSHALNCIECLRTVLFVWPFY